VTEERHFDKRRTRVVAINPYDPPSDAGLEAL
jgi:hypothetical protein